MYGACTVIVCMTDTPNSILLRRISDEFNRRSAERSLYEFVKQAWPVVEPGVDFVESWHIQVICEHLQAVTDGRIKRLLINIPPRHALALDTQIPTPNGMVSMRDLRVGDHVFGPDGLPVEVLGKSDVFADRRVYRVTTDDGAYVDVDGEHLWTVRLERKHKSIQTYTTEQLWHRQNGAFLRTKRSGGVELRMDRKCKDIRLPMLPALQPVQYQKVELPIDPYVLGVWLGDGHCAGARISQSDEDAIYLQAEIERRGFVTRRGKSKQIFGILGLNVKLRSLGLLGNKHIPAQYMTASVQQRRDLLKGLMDTDGNVSKKGQCFFTQSNYELIKQVQELVRSLGIKASIGEWEPRIGEKKYKTAYRLTFYASDVCHLPRKESRTLKTEREFGRYISVERLEKVADMQCIKVDRDDGLFVAGDGYIVTHNSKSTIVTVMWPCWEWIRYPDQKYLCASYSSILSIRDNLKARRLLQSPWYIARWGDVFQLAGDQNQKQRFENDRTGHRIATSVGGTATGEGGSRLILDDPHGAQSAQSDVLRASDLEWFDVVWSTRLNDPKTDAMVVVMQRLHENDISGHIIHDLRDWEHICIPAEYDGVKRKTILGPYDPRTKKNELICPARFGDAEITRLKQLLGEYQISGQLQQNPVPSGGGILKTEYFKQWPHDKPLPQFEYILQSYDTAFTEKSTGDPTGFVCFGVFTLDRIHQVMVLDCWDERLSYPDLRERVVAEWGAEYGGPPEGKYQGHPTRPRKADRILVEAKASGQSLLQDLRLARVPAVGYTPGNADKVSRAHQAAPTLELGIIWIPESRKNPGQFVSWAQPFVTQLAKFPVAQHDEYVDCFSQAILYLKNDKWLELPTANERDDDVRQKSNRINPYAQ